MKYPSVLYWKWDDSHTGTNKYISDLDDICNRSGISHIYITTHWCRAGLTTELMHSSISNACDNLHEKGRKIIFEIDARAEKSEFAKLYPENRMGFVYFKEITLDDNGKGQAKFQITAKSGGDFFLNNRQSGETLLRVYAVQQSGCLENAKDISFDCTLNRKSSDIVYIDIASRAHKDEVAFVLLCSWLDFPDFFSSEHRSYFDMLFERYAEIPLDGVALDEMGLPNHPDFDFSYASYLTWNNSPIFSYGMEEAYREKYESELLEDYLYMLCSSSHGKKKIRAINRYYELIRECICGEEQYFYNQGKRYFGKDAFIGVHPTWFAIDEIQITPEIWKNGLDWWGVPRDYGFTDEIMLYPVRLALTHKSGGNVFYNMWYGESTKRLENFNTEMWRNARYGGRTILLSYECINEYTIVEQLKEPGKLEAVSEIIESINLLDEFQTSPPASDVLIVMGIEACCNILCNLDGSGRWNTYYDGVLKESFTLARDIWNSGCNCDLVASYEVYNDSIFVGQDGYVHYGTETYRYLVFAYPQFSKKTVFKFLEQVLQSKTGLSIIGEYTADFDGADVQIEFETICKNVNYYAARPEALDLFAEFGKFDVRTYRVPCGSILQDGSVIVTTPSPNKPVGNIFNTEFLLNGHIVHIKAKDMAAIRLNNDGMVDKVCSPELIELEVDQKKVVF